MTKADSLKLVSTYIYVNLIFSVEVDVMLSQTLGLVQVLSWWVTAGACISKQFLKVLIVVIVNYFQEDSDRDEVIHEMSLSSGVTSTLHIITLE
jgi:hypothetical protein